MDTTIQALEPPKNQICAILRHMIVAGGASERKFPFNGFRSRLSNLRNDHGLNVQVRIIEFTNSFNRDSFYHEHYLLEEDKEAAIELYNRLNK